MGVIKDLTSGQNTALDEILADWQLGPSWVTNQALQAALAASGANWTGLAQSVAVALDGSGVVSVLRQAKISYFVLSPFAGAAQGTWTGVTELGQWSDGDEALFMLAGGKTIETTVFGTNCRMNAAEHFMKLLRVAGQWRAETQSPAAPTWPLSGTLDTQSHDAATANITAFASILSLAFTGGATAASAVYEVTAAAGTGGITYIYVEENGFASTIATMTYTSASSIAAIGLALEAEINAGTSYTAVWVGGGVNELTITDARNLGAAGNSPSLVLDFLCQGGAGGAITSNFAGGVNGAEAPGTVITIYGAAPCRRLTVFNNMSVEDLTLDSGGNIIVAAPVVLPAKTFKDLLSVDGTNWYLEA